MTSSKLKKNDQHTHDMTQIEGGHIDDRVGAAPGPDSVNRRVSGPGTEPGACISKLSLAVDVTKSLSTHNERLTSV